MAKLSFWRKADIILLLCAATAIAAPAQTFTSLHSFNNTDGGSPTAALIEGNDGNIYGTTTGGGSSGQGTVFKIDQAGALTTLYTFCTTPQSGYCVADGQVPNGLLQATDGNFYGTTEVGGAHNQGTVFKITPAGALTTLYNFCSASACADGQQPLAGLIQANDGNFYGTTSKGGTFNYNYGTVFQITPAGALTTLHSFNGTDGFQPSGALIQASDGNLYGTTSWGGAYGLSYNGTIFKITPTGTFTTLYNFCSQVNCADGRWPLAALIQGSDGNFYGTTTAGGAYDTKCSNHGCGTIFQMTPGGVLTTLHSFCAQLGCSDGVGQIAGLIQATDGNFYGTTEGGVFTPCSPSKCGTVFEITPKGTLAVLHGFNTIDGAQPVSGLLQAPDGSFYGTTDRGGTYGQGTIFRLAVAPTVKLWATSLAFGVQALNEASAAKTVTLANSGSAVLTIKNVTIAGSNFAISANACAGAELIPLKNCQISVTFTATTFGKQTGTLTFTDNAADSPQTIQLSGIGVEPATMLPAAANYGTATVGTVSAPKVFTLTNNQSMTLSNISVSATGDFAISATTCANTLLAKNKCTISVTFTPTTTGKRAGQLIVNDNASNNPQIPTLQGTGK
jgi:uncharacterized repeat protein (TIGR03803 family)